VIGQDESGKVHLAEALTGSKIEPSDTRATLRGSVQRGFIEPSDGREAAATASQVAESRTPPA